MAPEPVDDWSGRGRSSPFLLVALVPLVPLITYGDFGLSEGRRNVQVVGDVDVSEVVPVLDAPNGQPVDVVHGHVAW